VLDYKNKFIVIAGPCVIENRSQILGIASFLKDLLAGYPFLFIFKASFDKANRTSVKSFRGPGLIKGCKILGDVKKKFGVPILTDVHCRSQIKEVSQVADAIQIPAFLSRQTDLILDASKTGKIINIKKGQFLSPYDMKYTVEKIESTGNKNIFITERGVSFGYNNLVVDFRSFLIMKDLGYPVIFDATHSLQKPSVKGGVSGGDSKFVRPLSLAAAACGVSGLFLEVHPYPKRALSDKHTSFPLGKLKGLLDKVLKVKEAVK